MKQNPTPLKPHEIKMVRRASFIVLIIIIIISALATSCTPTLFDHFPLDAQVTKCTNDTITVRVGNDTLNWPNYNNQNFSKGDIITMAPEFRTIHSLP